MAYTFEWQDQAVDELTRIWLSATDRSSITIARVRIENERAVHPIGHGTLISEGLCKLVVSPLVAYCTIDTPQRKVEINWTARK